MVLEIEVGDKLKAKMDASTYKSNVMFAKELEDELMKFTTNCEENKVDNNVNGNITECTKSSAVEVVEAEYLDTTESSSSFDDGDSEVESVDNLGDSEAFSVFHHHGDDVLPLDFDEGLSLDFDGFGEMFRTRKRRPTTHWRSFIRPLMWRCKWVELQIKKFEEQAQNFERKIKECNQRKQVQLENHSRSEVLLRRKKRRRDELTKDLAAYMSNHNLFSYYENRNYFTDAASMDDDLNHATTNNDEYWDHDELLRVDPGTDDNSLENIFKKIESLQSQVHKLKSRVDKVTSEYGGRFSCSDNSSLPVAYNCLLGSPQNTDSPPNNEERIPVGTYIAAQLMEYNLADLLLPENALTTHGELIPDVNGNTNLLYFPDAYGNGDDGVLIDNQRVKEEMHSFEQMKIEPIQRPPLVPNNLSITSPPVQAEPDLPMNDRPPLKKEMHSVEQMKIEPIQRPSLVLNNLSITSHPVQSEPDLPMNDRPPLKIRSISNLAPPKTKSKSKKGRRKAAGS